MTTPADNKAVLAKIKAEIDQITSLYPSERIPLEAHLQALRDEYGRVLRQIKDSENAR